MMKREREEAKVLILDVTDYVTEQTNSESISRDKARGGWNLFFLQKI